MGAEGHAECAVREDGERLGDAAFSCGVSCSPARSAPLAEPQEAPLSELIRIHDSSLEIFRANTCC